MRSKSIVRRRDGMRFVVRVAALVGVGQKRSGLDWNGGSAVVEEDDETKW